MAFKAPSLALAYDAAAAAPESTPVVREAPEDSAFGWKMFVAFNAAVIAITTVVGMLALVGSWAMLGVTMLVHVGITAMVMKLILGGLGSEEHTYPDMHQAEQASRAALARAAGATPLVRPQLAAHV